MQTMWMFADIESPRTIFAGVAVGNWFELFNYQYLVYR